MNKLNLTVGSQTLTVFVAERDGETWVAVRPLCEILGLQVQRQKQRLKSNPQFKVVTYVTPSGQGEQETICIPVNQVGMWICTINANKVKPEVKQQLIDFQMHLQVVIHDALTGRVTAEKMEWLEKQVAMLTSLVQQLSQRLAHFEDTEASFAGSRMARQRWTCRDGLKLVQ